MSISVVFYTFSKEVNSTAQPTGAGTSFDCILRSDTSVISPSIELMTSGNPCSYNYCHISDFGRYYFVQDWISVKGRWVAKLTVDVLATYKSQITASSQYVSRSASDKDEYISDGFYPCKAEYDYEFGTTSGSNPFDMSNICFVVGIIGGSHPIGSVTYYCLTPAQLQSLLSYISNDYSVWSGLSISDFTDAVQKTMINPFQYIVSCHCLPFAAQGSGTTTLKFGPYTWSGGTSVYYLSANYTQSRSLSFTIPKHPDVSTTGKYLNCSPFTSYTAYCGPFGEIPVDSAYCQDESSLTYKVDFDFISGDAILTIYNTSGLDGAVIRSAHVGVDIVLSATAIETGKQVASMASVIATTQSYEILTMGGASKFASAILDMGANNFPQMERRGSQGSFVGWKEPTSLVAKFMKQVDTDNTHNGSPLMQVKTISSLSGFTIVMNPDISIPGTSEESESIKNFMLSGFYIE